MAGIMGRFFDFRSKEEKARSYEAYSKRIFPYGDDQKDRVSELLAELFPKEKQKNLMMHYILIKQGMTDEDPLDFSAAAKKAAKYRILRVTPELEATMQALLNIDFDINEDLQYPSIEELQSCASKLISMN